MRLRAVPHVLPAECFQLDPADVQRRLEGRCSCGIFATFRYITGPSRAGIANSARHQPGGLDASGEGWQGALA